MSGPQKPLGREEARALMEQVRSEAARQSMPPLPVLRSAVMALAANCEMILQLLDIDGAEAGEEERGDSGGPVIFGR